MGHSKQPRRGRARPAPADSLFERALLGHGSFEDKAFDPRRDRKTLQLCRQVQRALAMALGGECADVLLADAYVESVEPLGGPGQLFVRVVVPADTAAPPAAVAERLAALTPRLRAVVASEIYRKRVPALSFVVVPIHPAGGPDAPPQYPDSARPARHGGARDQPGAADDSTSRGGGDSRHPAALPWRAKEGGEHGR